MINFQINILEFLTLRVSPPAFRELIVESGTKGVHKSKLLPKPNKNGTNIDHKLDQSGPGGKGPPQNQQKYKKVKKNANVKNQDKKNVVFEM